MSTLQNAVEALYAVFARYKAWPALGAALEVTDGFGRSVDVSCLRQLDAAALEDYTLRAVTTWGSVEDFKYVFPRLMELFTAGSPPGLFQIFMDKLAYANWQSWPRVEREAVCASISALWNDVLERYPHGIEIDAVLCGIGQVVDGLSPLLRQWASDPGEPAARHLAEFVESNIGELSNKPGPLRLRSAFWAGRPQQATEALRWLLDPQRIVDLERAFFESSSPQVQHDLSSALTSLQTARQRALMLERPPT